MARGTRWVWNGNLTVDSNPRRRIHELQSEYPGCLVLVLDGDFYYGVGDLADDAAKVADGMLALRQGMYSVVRHSILVLTDRLSPHGYVVVADADGEVSVLN